MIDKIKLDPLAKKLAEWQLAHYKSDKQELESIENAMIHIPTAKYGGAPPNGGSYEKRPTEQEAMRLMQMQPPYVRRLSLGIYAVDKALAQADKVDVDLVRLVYWEQRCTIDGAAMRNYISKTAAYKRINRLLILIAFELGYVKLK